MRERPGGGLVLDFGDLGAITGTSDGAPVVERKGCERQGTTLGGPGATPYPFSLNPRSPPPDSITPRHHSSPLHGGAPHHVFSLPHPSLSLAPLPHLAGLAPLHVLLLQPLEHHRDRARGVLTQQLEDLTAMEWGVSRVLTR